MDEIKREVLITKQAFDYIVSVTGLELTREQYLFHLWNWSQMTGSLLSMSDGLISHQLDKDDFWNEFINFEDEYHAMFNVGSS